MKSRKSSCVPDSPRYTGRFAPSPSGPLHFGSLLAAVASFLDARAHGGRWLLRMEDLDPEREPPGTDRLILGQLEEFELFWDGPVLYQSSRHQAYAEILEILWQRGLCYCCDCPRQRIRALEAVYDGHCRDRGLAADSNSAMRLRVGQHQIGFEDRIQGYRLELLAESTGDFIIRRRDGLFAYQLAVVVDDAWQQVSHVVRGYDLLESTARQILLQQLLGFPTPSYAHIPLITNTDGQKLSKQNLAPAIDKQQRGELIFRCLVCLGLNPASELANATVAEQLQWATTAWHIQAIPKLANIPEPRPSSR